MTALSRISGRKLVLYIGSSIGNFEPDEAIRILRRIRRTLRPGDALLLGADFAKSPKVLLPAYDDSQGVTAAFNKNILARLNRELDADFDVDCFRHVPAWNRRLSRIEAYLESTTAQSVFVPALDLDLSFAPGERIHTENSYKYTDDMIESILSEGGFKSGAHLVRPKEVVWSSLGASVVRNRECRTKAVRPVPQCPSLGEHFQDGRTTRHARQIQPKSGKTLKLRRFGFCV